MAKKKYTRSSRRPLFIALFVTMLLSTVVFAFVGCNTRNKAEEPDEEQMENYPEEEDPPLDEEKKDEPKEEEEEKKPEEQKPVTPPVAPPVVTTPTVPVVKPTPTPTPSKPVTPPTATSKYGSITITKNGRYSETKTYQNVTIKADDVKLSNKTIKGNLIIDKSVDDDSVITLDNVTVGGEIIINGGFEFNLYDVEADLLKVRKKSGRVELAAYDKTEIKEVDTVRSIYLKEDDLDKGYDGFVDLTTSQSGNIYMQIDLRNCDLEAVYCKDNTKLKAVDGHVSIDTVKAYDRVELGRGVDVKTFTVYVDDCTYVIEPNKIYTKNGADEPERYTGKDKDHSSGGSSSGGTNTPAISTPVVSLVYDSVKQEVIASWGAVSNAVSYKVSYSKDNGYSWSPYQQIPVGKAVTISQTITGITDPVNFRIKVLAVDSNGKESSAGGTNSTVQQKLATPTNVKVVFANGVPTVSWNSVSGTSNYLLTYTIGGTTTSGVSVNGTTSYQLPKVSGTTTVTAQVKAVGNNSSTMDSDFADKTSTTITKLDAPSTAPTVTVNATDVVLTWDANASATNYFVEYKIGTNESKTAQTSTNSLTISEAVPAGTTVTAKVKSIGNGSTTLDSDYSAAGSGSKAATALAAPAVNTPTFDNTTNKFTVSWSEVSGASSYTVKYTIDGIVTSEKEITVNPGTSVQLPDEVTENGKQLTVLVRANGDGTNYSSSGFSNPVTASSALAQLPNPTATLEGNNLTFACDGATSFAYTVTVDGSAGTLTTGNTVDLSSYRVGAISVSVVAKAPGKLDSTETKVWENTPLPTPTPSTATYDGTATPTVTLTFADSILSDKGNYTVVVKDSSSKELALTSTTPNIAKKEIVVMLGEVPTTGDYSVEITATTKNILVSNAASSGTSSFKVS